MSLVLAAIDNSAAARPVLSAARALARILDADVKAIYVADGQGQTARACADSMQIPFQCVEGDPLETLVTEASTPAVAAIAIGARRRVGERGVGHLVKALADRIDKPVLVVPPNLSSIERFRTALVAMEGTRERSREVKATIQIVANSELDLFVLHVDDEATIPSFSDQLAHETEAYATEFLARHLPGGPGAHLEFRVGSPAEEILSAIGSLGADLVAIGWPQSRGPGRGRNVEAVLGRSLVPVLLIALDDRGVVPSRPARESLSM